MIGEAVRSGWVTTGPEMRQFESDFAAYVAAQHAIAFNFLHGGDAAGTGSNWPIDRQGSGGNDPDLYRHACSSTSSARLTLFSILRSVS